jgi:kinesin family protein 2/24
MISISFFEIYGGRCQDLLNNRNRLTVREDGHGEVVVADLKEIPVDTAANLAAIIDAGNRNRTTHATESNDESSRSHAICQITLYDTGSGAVVGRMSLIDLAGSERGADTKSHNRQRRMEGAEINKSLLALKECIRALDSGNRYAAKTTDKPT